MLRASCLFLLFLMSTISLSAQAVDTVPPHLECVNSPQNVMLYWTGMLTIWPADLVDSVSDNSGGPVELGIRPVCVGTGFPSEPYLLLVDFGPYRVEVWARDTAGNTTACLVNLYASGNGFIDPAASWRVESATADNQPLPGVEVLVKYQHCYFGADSMIGGITYTSTFYTGWAFTGHPFGSIAPVGSDLWVTPRKNQNPLNGVSTADLVRIQRHILDIEPFSQAAQFIAADANQDGKITSYDLVILQKLILGISAELPNGRSWRFWPADYVFPDPENPLAPAFPELYFQPHVFPVPGIFQFIGVKIGDVDGSADPEQ